METTHRHTIRRLLAAAAVILSLTACRQSGQRTAIEITPSSTFVEAGRSLDMTASLTTFIENADGSTERISTEDVTGSCEWSTSDETVLKHYSRGKFLSSAPGSATVTATCGKTSGDCAITVTSKRTGIEVRNLKTELRTGEGLTAASVKPEGGKVSFTCGWSLEYRTTYAEGEPSQWFSASSADGTEGPLTAGELESKYGLKREVTMEKPGEQEYADNFILKADGNPEKGFSIDVPAHHYTEPHGCDACYVVSLAGNTDTSRNRILQKADSYKVEYGDTAVHVMLIKKTYIAHGGWEDLKIYCDTTICTVKDYTDSWPYEVRKTIHMNVLRDGNWSHHRIEGEGYLTREKHKAWASGCHDEGWETERLQQKVDVRPDQNLECGFPTYDTDKFYAKTDSAYAKVTVNGNSKYDNKYYIQICVIRHYMNEEEFLSQF